MVRSDPDASRGSGAEGEAAIRVRVTVLPGGTRDFELVRRGAEGARESVHPLDLLALDRTAELIERAGRQQPALAPVLALCRLLVPCLRDRGSGRHLVVEPWSEADLRGEGLPADVRTPLARELAAEQAEAWRLAVAGGRPAEGSLAELFWEAHTELPALPGTFEDPELGRLARALYLHLVPEGEGWHATDSVRVKAAVEACRASAFAPLGLDLPRRRLPGLFLRLLAVTVRYAGQLTGAVAEGLVRERVGPAGWPLRPAERALLELRYGASPALGDVNLGLLAGSGPLLAGLIAEYARELAGPGAEPEGAGAAGRLRAFIDLLVRFRRRRKAARAAERHEDRQRHADRMPRDRGRVPAEGQPDRSSPDPSREAAVAEERELLREEVLPLLKPRDRARLEALIDCGGDRRAAAERLGLTLEAYSRQLRQTVLPTFKQTLASRRRGARPGPGGAD